MANFILSAAAEQDILATLAWTHKQFGARACLRYEALLGQALFDIAEDPNRIGVCKRDEIRPGTFTYHLWHSRMNVDATVGRVRRPRHFLLFRVVGDVIELGRLLHDSMDLDDHLPQAY